MATVCISAILLAGARISLLAMAVLKRSACAKKPIFGFSWKIFCQPAVMEVMNRNTVGIIVTQTYFCFFILNRMTVRSEEHTSELQSRENLVCRLLLEKKKKTT